MLTARRRHVGVAARGPRTTKAVVWTRTNHQWRAHRGSAIQRRTLAAETICRQPPDATRMRCNANPLRWTAICRQSGCCRTTPMPPKPISPYVDGHVCLAHMLLPPTCNAFPFPVPSSSTQVPGAEPRGPWPACLPLTSTGPPSRGRGRRGEGQGPQGNVCPLVDGGSTRCRGPRAAATGRCRHGAGRVGIPRQCRPGGARGGKHEGSRPARGAALGGGSRGQEGR